MTSKMPWLPLVGRILIGIMFVLAGISKAGAIVGTTKYIASKGLPAAQILTYLTIIFEIVAGAMLIVGYRTWIAASALAIFCVLTAVIFHNYWSMQGAAVRINQVFFMKNLAIAGGLLAFAYFGSGPLGLDSRKGG